MRSPAIVGGPKAQSAQLEPGGLTLVVRVAAGRQVVPTKRSEEVARHLIEVAASVPPQGQTTARPLREVCTELPAPVRMGPHGTDSHEREFAPSGTHPDLAERT